MKIPSLFALVTVLSSPLAYGQSMLRGFHGVTQTDNGLPLSGVQVVVNIRVGARRRLAPTARTRTKGHSPSRSSNCAISSTNWNNA
jgi:hypothetical protein